MAYETNGLNGAGPIHFTNVRILDATGEYSYTGEVIVQGNRIKQITRGSSRLMPASRGHNGTVIDGMARHIDARLDRRAFASVPGTMHPASIPSR